MSSTEEATTGGDTNSSNHLMLTLLREYGWPHKGKFFVGVISSIAARGFELIPAFLLAVAIDSILTNNRPFDLPLVPSEALPSEPLAQVYLTVGIITIAFLFEAFFHAIRDWGQKMFAQSLLLDLRTDTYDEMQELGMEYFSNEDTGNLVSILNNDVNNIEEFFTSVLSDAIRIVAILLIISIVLFSTNWQLALVSLLPVPLIAGFSYKYGNFVGPRYGKLRHIVGKLTSRLEDNLHGIHVIKTHASEKFESERVERVSKSYFDAKRDLIKAEITIYPGVRLPAGLGFALTFLIGAIWVLDGPIGPFSGTLTAGEFVLFFFYTRQFVWPLSSFGEIINKYQQAKASSERILGLRDENRQGHVNDEAPELNVSEGEVEFDDVTFRYDDENDPALQNVDVEIEGGQYVGLVGPTGAGKTTLLKLIVRLYDPDSGTVRIDGTDVSTVDVESLRESIGYVGQESFLFSGSVRENIAYGTSDHSEEEVIEAAKAAEAHEFVQNLPDGYDTQVGEQGAKLSGGQRQRLTIARAILKDPDILLLDEATSDVDTETELLIQRSLNRLIEDRTTFAIAHRLSTIRDADRIIVLEDGEVAESGDHDELLERDGIYAKLWHIQSGNLDEISDQFVRQAIERRAEVRTPN